MSERAPQTPKSNNELEPRAGRTESLGDFLTPIVADAEEYLQKPRDKFSDPAFPLAMKTVNPQEVLERVRMLEETGGLPDAELDAECRIIAYAADLERSWGGIGPDGNHLGDDNAYNEKLVQFVRSVNKLVTIREQQK